MQLDEIFRADLFQGKTVFVTGGGSGINLGIAKSFAELGADLALCGRTEERLASAAVELQERGARTFTQVADVRDFDALVAAFDGQPAHVESTFDEGRVVASRRLLDRCMDFRRGTGAARRQRDSRRAQR